MFKYKKSYKEIFAFCFLNNDIFILEKLKSGFKSVHKISDDNSELLIEGEQLNSIQYFENIIWVIGIKGVWIITPANNNVKLIQDFYVRYTEESLGNRNLFYRKKNDLRSFCLLNWNTNEVEWEITYFSTIYLSTFINLFFVEFSSKLERTIIRAFSFNSKVQLWEYDVSEIGSYRRPGEFEDSIGEVLQFAGCYKGMLNVLITGGKYIALNVDTGELCWELKDVAVNKTKQQFDFGLGAYHPFLNEEEGLIYELQGDVFSIIDLKIQQASFEWTSLDLPESEYLFFIQTKLFNNQIYFTAYRSDNFGNADTIGIFDIASQKIIWRHRLDLGKRGFIPNSQEMLQVNEKRIGVLDNTGTLHVFEKEITGKPEESEHIAT